MLSSLNKSELICGVSNLQFAKRKKKWFGCNETALCGLHSNLTVLNFHIQLTKLLQQQQQQKGMQNIVHVKLK